MAQGFSIKRVGEHYELNIDGAFMGSYDTYGEAVRDAERELYSEEAR